MGWTWSLAFPVAMSICRTLTAFQYMSKLRKRHLRRASTICCVEYGIFGLLACFTTVTPTRKFWIHVMESKIHATIRNEGDMIGWESDNETVGPVALAAKRSLLRAIPQIMPPENADQSLYRLVLEHGDFGIHNTLITTDANGKPPRNVSIRLGNWMLRPGCSI